MMKDGIPGVDFSEKLNAGQKTLTLVNKNHF